MPSIDHKDLIHIPNPAKCHPTYLSICPMFRPLNLQYCSQSLAWQLHSHQRCRPEPLNPLLLRTPTLMLSSFALLQTDSSLPLPTVKLIPPSNTTALQSKLSRSKIASSTTRKHSSEPPRAMSSMTDMFPTSTFLVATGSHTQLSGSSSTTMAQYPGTQTLMGPTPCPLSSTCMWNQMTNTMKKARQNPHSLSQHGSGTLWWAPPLTSNYYITPSSLMTIGASPARYTATMTLILN